MKINRNNCESKFLDYHEKNLSPVEVAEVLLFLENNPELKQVFESYEAIHLEHEKINFPDKESLKKKYSMEEIEKILSSEITKSNCEQFFVANAEELLSAEQKEKVNIFLSQNPELKKDYALFQKSKLSAETFVFETKNLLKKEIITEQNKEEYFIRATENELSASEKQELFMFLDKNPADKKEFALFQKTILVPEKTSFPKKSSLKKKERKPVFIPIYSNRAVYYAVAASVLLLVGLFLFFRDNDNADKHIFAEKNNALNQTPVNLQKSNGENPIKDNEQKAESQTNKTHNNERQTTNSKRVRAKDTSDTKTNENKQEDINFHLVLSEDITDEKLSAQIEIQHLPMMQAEDILTYPIHLKDRIVAINKNASASLTKKVKHDSDNYQTLSAFVTKKVRSLLGVKNTNPCGDSDKLGWWDLAMAAKKQIQKITGTNVIDVNKVCNGNENQVEYVFAAGNFEFSKSAEK